MFPTCTVVLVTEKEDPLSLLPWLPLKKEIKGCILVGVHLEDRKIKTEGYQQNVILISLIKINVTEGLGTKLRGSGFDGIHQNKWRQSWNRYLDETYLPRHELNSDINMNIYPEMWFRLKYINFSPTHYHPDTYGRKQKNHHRNGVQNSRYRDSECNTLSCASDILLKMHPHVCYTFTAIDSPRSQKITDKIASTKLFCYEISEKLPVLEVWSFT